MAKIRPNLKPGNHVVCSHGFNVHFGQFEVPKGVHTLLVAQGWTDAIRHLHPKEPMFTFWDYKRDRWRRDAGLRLDHLLVSPVLAPRLKKAGVDRLTRGEEGASDHAPAWIELR